ncbi:MAG: hypothetical protein NT062_07075 [Proteobacteria bacterium]|nr:hypothetical protein [Pseudomonadota bacterium]
MAIWGSSATDIWAGGDDLVHFDGTTWTAVPTPPLHARLQWIWGSGPSSVFAGGGDLLHFDGTTWVALPTPIAGLTMGAWGSRATDVWMVGLQGPAMHYDGASWSSFAIAPPGQLSGVGGSAEDDVWLVGDQRTVLHWAQRVPAPAGGACTRPIALACGTRVYGETRVGDPNRFAAYPGCVGARADTGGEIAYELESPISGDITITMTPHDGDLDLVVLDDDALGGCDGASCRAVAQASGLAAETVTLAGVAAGQRYYAVIDGFAGAASAYTLDVVCTKK